MMTIINIKILKDHITLYNYIIILIKIYIYLTIFDKIKTHNRQLLYFMT